MDIFSNSTVTVIYESAVDNFKCVEDITLSKVPVNISQLFNVPMILLRTGILFVVFPFPWIWRDWQKLYCWTGRSWRRISGNLVHISVGSQVWGVNRGQHIYKYMGGNRWKHMPGRLVNVRVFEEIKTSRKQDWLFLIEFSHIGVFGVTNWWILESPQKLRIYLIKSAIHFNV